MNTRALFGNLTTKFGIIRSKLELESSTSFYGLNNELESIVVEILNEVYGYDFKSTNLSNFNCAGIDAIDNDNKIMLQITSTCTRRKINETITKIIQNHEDFRAYTLYFFFINKKKALTQSTIKSIENLSKGKVIIDVSNNLLDWDSLYRYMYHNNLTAKALSVVGILDKFLNYLPLTKRSGYNAISISCSDSTDFAYAVVDSILKLGINVFINSSKLYKRFERANHGLIDFLVYVSEFLPIEHITHCIVILSNSYIYKNLNRTEVDCFLLVNALKNDSRIQFVSNHEFVDLHKIDNVNFRGVRKIPENTLVEDINDIVQELFGSTIQKFSFSEDVISELKKINPGFKVEELNNDNGYSLFQFTSLDFDDYVIYYMVLKENYTMNSICNHFLKKFNSTPNNRLVVLLPKDPYQKTRKRIDNIKKNLSVERVHFIDEYLFDKVLSGFKQEYRLNIEDYVDPLILDHSGAEHDIYGVLNWFTSETKSKIAIIHGQGGVGKTTFCEKIHDKIIDKNEYRHHVIFIKSSDLLEHFRSIDFRNKKEYEIYNIYKIWCQYSAIENNDVLDENSFYINCHMGNILIIFDGIDEILSTIPDFTLKSFLENVLKIESGMRNGKIIINCRDSYVSEIEDYFKNQELSHVEIFKLLPFDILRAQDYFSKHFTQPRKIKSSMDILNEFLDIKKVNYKKNIYPPFVLEIVKQIVDNEFAEHSRDYTFDSILLSEQDFTDRIICKTCLREAAKKDRYGFALTTDQQLEFMIELAVKLKGNILENDFKTILYNIGHIDRVDEVAKSLIDHPFLIRKDNVFKFRFDFLMSYFLSLGIVKFILNPEGVVSQQDIVCLIDLECNINSPISRQIQSKISEVKKLDLINFKNAIKFINNFKIRDGIKQKAISNLILTLANASGIENIESNTEILKQIFLEQDTIENLFLIEIRHESKLLFDFSGLIFHKCRIEKYEDFFNCTFDDNTLFDETCEINKVECRTIDLGELSATRDNFDSAMKGDNSVYRITDIKNAGDLSHMLDSQSLNCFQCFMRCFIKSDKWRKSSKDAQINYSNSMCILDFEIVKKILSDSGILNDEGLSLSVPKQFRNKVKKFVNENVNFNEMNDALALGREKIELVTDGKVVCGN